MALLDRPWKINGTINLKSPITTRRPHLEHLDRFDCKTIRKVNN
jgi:hypothetical protein